MNKDTFCVLPWSGLEINADGTVRPCCFFNERVKNNNKEMNVAVDSIESIRNSQYLQNLRQSFLQGEAPEACNQCWSKESAGLFSERINANQQYNNLSLARPTSTAAGDLNKIGVALGNICNLKCRICGPWASSSWNADEIKMMSRDQLTGTMEESMMTLGAWPLKNPEFWTEFAEQIKTVTELRIYGGEPFMIPKHFEVLKFLVDNNHAQNIKLVYNTNGTHFPEQAIEYWKKFQQVHVSLSIDNLGQKFEYERKNARWGQLLENLEKFNQAQQQYKNIKLQCTVTVSVYNVLDLVEIAQWIEQQQFCIDTFWNILQFSEYHNIAHLSAGTKQQIKDKLVNSKIKISHYNQRNIDNVIKYMMNNSLDSLESVLIQEIQRVDQFRKESLQSSHPELWALLTQGG